MLYPEQYNRITHSCTAVITTMNLSQSSCLISWKVQHRGYRMCVGMHLYGNGFVSSVCAYSFSVLSIALNTTDIFIYIYYRTDSFSIHSTPSCLLCLSAVNLHPLTLRAKEPIERSEASSSALPSSFTLFCPHN